MNCKEAKSLIALWAGQDLDDAELEALQPHLAECPNCSGHWDEMKSSMDALQQASGEDLTRDEFDSLWPKVAAKISTRQAASGNVRRNRWLPAIAVAAVCIAVAVVMNYQPDLNIYEVGQGVNPRLLPDNFVEFYPDDSFKQLQEVDAPVATIEENVDPSTLGVNKVSIGGF
ncbi:MAG: hypothetical protein CMJ78_15630 [Planctomycetaceae bacterium]|nr:hypothetical protein [Planctomycetaceae bacterium]